MNGPETDTIEKMSRLASCIMSLLSSQKPSEQLIADIVLLIRETVDVHSVGLRLTDGPDFPYYFTQGFDQAFIEKEMYLCARDQLGELIRDSDGNPVLECMCGNVISGRTDPTLPFFTEDGCFWTNSTTELLSSTSERDRQSRTRNRCNGEGYESVALIPVKASGRCFGLLQLNDHRKNRFEPELISFLAGTAVNIALLFSMSKMIEQLTGEAADAARFVAVRRKLLKRLADELRTRQSKPLNSQREEKILNKIDALLEEVDALKGIIPICSTCKRVRIDPDFWMQVEQFVRDRSPADFSHTYCPDCFAAFQREWKI